MVGLIALWHPEIMGGGYGTMQKALFGGFRWRSCSH